MSWLTYNSLLVLAGTTLLGAACGLIGFFLTLRRQALLSDVISHAALPGVALAFIVGEWLAPNGQRSVLWLAGGALFASAIALMICSTLQKLRLLRGDAAFGIPLGGFLAVGVVLFSIVQQMPLGNAAGLESYLFGRAAALSTNDVFLLGGLAAGVLVVCLVCQKELLLVAFDPEYALAQGWPVARLDALLTAMVACICVLALPMVGFLLVVALMVTPPASARFWTHRTGLMMAISSLLGMLAAVAGTIVSGMSEQVPTGPAIVLFATLLFIVSAICGASHGWIHRWWSDRRQRSERALDDLLRNTYEAHEAAQDRQAALLPAGHDVAPEIKNAGVEGAGIELPVVYPPHLRETGLQALKRMGTSRGFLRLDSRGKWRLTTLGVQRAKAVVLRHRLIELYLIEHAEFPPDQGDRTADLLEHALGPHTVDELKEILRVDFGRGVVRSPHPLETNAAEAMALK
jgi:manganese/zinc/iron transport system permease protein